MSDDYAVPPDALSCDTTSLESSMLLRASYLDSPKRIESLEKSGSLAKLGTWIYTGCESRSRAKPTIVISTVTPQVWT